MPKCTLFMIIISSKYLDVVLINKLKYRDLCQRWCPSLSDKKNMLLRGFNCCLFQGILKYFKWSSKCIHWGLSASPNACSYRDLWHLRFSWGVPDPLYRSLDPHMQNTIKVQQPVVSFLQHGDSLTRKGTKKDSTKNDPTQKYSTRWEKQYKTITQHKNTPRDGRNNTKQ